MAGIYIHIPFCEKKCHYCDFYKSLSLSLIPDFIQAVEAELELRANYIPERQIETIYFGGGTPSTLSCLQINKILDAIQNRFTLSENPEITLEANPDDLSGTYVSELKKTKINRISLGIQSFDDADLKLMNRRHSAQEAVSAVKLLQDKGFENISGDLIYGLPDMNPETWTANLDRFFALNIPHLSAYHLTYEKDTVFYKKMQKGELSELPDDKSEVLFEILSDKAKLAGYEQYEISNFAKPGCQSRHNSAYWMNRNYLGLGASAHSYNGKTRQWNPSDIQAYISGYLQGQIITETEIIDADSAYNEFIMKRLRTSEGISKTYLNANFDLKYRTLFYQVVSKYLKTKHLQETQDTVSLTRKGIFISDTVISEMFYV